MLVDISEIKQQNKEAQDVEAGFECNVEEEEVLNLNEIYLFK